MAEILNKVQRSNPPTLLGPHAGTPPAELEEGNAQMNEKPDGSLSAKKGQTLGKYTISRRLGKGGMGVVYQAEDPMLERSVAIKLLPHSLSNNPTALQRFLLEARSAARLNHPNVVTVYEINELKGAYYLAMELVDGGSGQDLLLGKKRLPWKEATEMIADACRGLAAAHAVGLVHRDIKPANLLRTSEGQTKLADFGLVKPTDDSHRPVTEIGIVVGTPHFMSPEQCRSHKLDSRSDIYSLGATYFALLTGKVPFPGDGPMEVMFAHCNTPIPDPRRFQKSIPEEAIRVLERAMAKRKEDRFPSAQEMLVELETLLASTTTASPSELAKNSVETVKPKTPFVTVEPKQTSAPPKKKSSTKTKPAQKKGSKKLGTAAPQVEPSKSAPSKEPSPQSKSVPRIEPPTKTRRWALGALATVSAFGFGAWWFSRDSSSPTPTPHTPSDSGSRTTGEPFATTIPAEGVEIFSGDVGDVAFSPDGKYFAVTAWVNGSKGVRVWDYTTGKLHRVLWHVYPFRSVTFSPDSRWLIAGTVGKILGHDLARDKQVELVQDRVGQINLSLSFSPDSKLLAVGSQTAVKSEGLLQLWDLTTRTVLASKVGDASAYESCAFSLDGDSLATGGREGVLRFWKVPGLDDPKEFKGSPIYNLEFSKRDTRLRRLPGKRLGVARADGIEMFNLLTMRHSPPLNRFKEKISSVAFLPTGERFAVGAESGTIILRTSTAGPPTFLRRHKGPVTKLAFSPDGETLLSAGKDEKAILWNVSKALAKS